LSELAITTLSLPFSNAEVERVFSQMNLIKSKTRNKMGTELLTSLLQIRSGLKKHGQCCHNFILPNEVIKNIGTSSIYTKNECNVTTDILEEFDDIFYNH